MKTLILDLQEISKRLQERSSYYGDECDNADTEYLQERYLDKSEALLSAQNKVESAIGYLNGD